MFVPPIYRVWNVHVVLFLFVAIVYAYASACIVFVCMYLSLQ